MNRNAGAAIAATIVVVVVVVLGFRALGGPATQRLVRSDVRTIRTLTELAQEINQGWRSSGKVLPRNLEKFPNSLTLDPISAKSFGYRIKSVTAYELCGTFATDSRVMQATNPNDHWTHPKGDYCFEFEASQPVPFVPYDY
jgi:hypothetical protein